MVDSALQLCLINLGVLLIPALLLWLLSVAIRDASIVDIFWGPAFAILAWSSFGLVIALGRYATVTAIAFTVQAPALVWAVLIPGLIVHGIFGILSGIVTAPLLRALDKREREREASETEDPG